MSRLTLRSAISSWSRLNALSVADVEGDLEADFLAPLRRVAPAGLGLIGLPRWYGKRIAAAGEGSGTGMNLIRQHGALVEVMPMQLAVGPSLLDGAPTLVVSYRSDARRPWRWVRDELRQWSDGTIIGMTIVDLPGLRHFGTPFLLRRPGGTGR